LGFPPALPPDHPAPQEFSLQFWEGGQKKANAGAIIGIMGILVGSKGGTVSFLFQALHALF
jgi:intracellular protein transport protein USO1